MSHAEGKISRVTVPEILQRKSQAKKISMVTCYDASFAKLIDKTAIDMVLVGDSLGNVILGFENTIPVTVEHMIHHGAAVGRVLKRPLLCIDMPFFSYNVSIEQALTNAGLIMQQTGAQAVKLEGGMHVVDRIEALVKHGIPVVGHLGLTPQSVNMIGGYKVQGREKAAEKEMIKAAKAIEQAGAFCLVLELVPAKLSKKITSELKIPTIGIGAGSATDGQVLVMQDLLGFDESFTPKFLKQYAQLGKLIENALTTYDQEVKDGKFPTEKHSFE